MAEEIKPVYAVASHIVSASGMGVNAHWDAVADCRRGIAAYTEHNQQYCAGRLNNEQHETINNTIMDTQLSAFEKLCLFSARAALAQCSNDICNSDTVVLLSTTKGNIERLNIHPDSQTLLSASASVIVKELNIPTQPVVISHACVSGAVALLYAQRLLSSGRYRNAIVIGCDLFTPFVLNGFMSFHAIDSVPCRPFDAARKGVNLGEAAATIILSSATDNEPLAKLTGGATSNDANHISGPSRTGEELADAIDRAMSEAGITAADIDMISAHGTATVYNDEMEAKALHLSGLSNTPMHSMKSYTGHTLGAAGILESAMVIRAIQEQQLIPSAGYENHGVSVPVNVTTKMQPTTINYVLKTASGFGGSNAAIVWAKP